MSSPIEEATVGHRDAREILRRAEDRLYAYLEGTCNLPPGVTYQDISAEVTACRAVLAGAQDTLQAVAAYSLRISARFIQRITLQEYLQTIPPLPNYSDTLPDPTSEIPPFVRHPQITLHWESFE